MTALTDTITTITGTMGLASLDQWPEQAVTDLYTIVQAEYERRRVLRETEQIVDDLAKRFMQYRDGTQPQVTDDTLKDTSAWPAWHQPLGAHDAYPDGYVVQHGGKLWRSKIPGNNWEPGGVGVPDGLWEEAKPGDDATNPVTPDAPKEWVAGASYQVGDRVSWGGDTYRCIQAHTAQSIYPPDIVPALWVKA